MCGELTNRRALIVRSTFHFFAVYFLFCKAKFFSHESRSIGPFNSSVVGKQSDRSSYFCRRTATYYLQLGIMIEQILRKN